MKITDKRVVNAKKTNPAFFLSLVIDSFLKHIDEQIENYQLGKVYENEHERKLAEIVSKEMKKFIHSEAAVFILKDTVNIERVDIDENNKRD